MLKNFLLIGLILVFFKMNSQIPQQSEWDRNIKILQETMPMFNIKLYDKKDLNRAITINTYAVEDNYLIATVWERSTMKSKTDKMDLRCLTKVELNCEYTCALILLFNNEPILKNISKKDQITLSNCEVKSQNNCHRLTWSRENKFVTTAMQAFNFLIMTR